MIKTIKLTQNELFDLVREAYRMGLKDMERTYEPFDVDYDDDDLINHLDLVLKLWEEKTK